MDPFYEYCKRKAVGGGLGGREKIGEVYKRGVFHQRGYGYKLRRTYGLGFGSSLLSLFRMAAPALKSGLKYLGNTAVNAAANIAHDAVNGDSIKESARQHLRAAAEDIFAKAPEALMNAGPIRVERKRTVASRSSAGRLAASARKRKKAKTSHNFEEYPALSKLV